MLDISKVWDLIIVKDWNKKEITFDTAKTKVAVDWFVVDFPGEYEKSGILAEVREFGWILFYSFTVDSKHLFVVTTDKLEIKEDVLSFFGDIDILIIVGTKDAVKLFENLEAKLVVPYGETKDIFLNSLGQHMEEINTYRVKWDLDVEKSEFVNLG